MARMAWLLGLTLAALVALAAAASADVCVAYLVTVGGPHLHVLC